MTELLNSIGQRATAAAQALAQLSTTTKNQVLRAMADALEEKTPDILAVNQEDLADTTGLEDKFIDRLTLTADRLAGIADGVRQVANLPDPLGNIDRGWTTESGLEISQKRVPLGVVGIIYEARPNVTVDSAVLCFKSGNAVILRGGKEALQTNIKIAAVVRDVLAAFNLPQDAVQVITETSHELAQQFMQLNQYVDVLIPRGSARLIQTVVQNATVPVIETGAGNCHIYVDETADLQMAENVIINAKTQRPSVCNATEKLLVNAEIAADFLPQIATALANSHVEIRGDEQTCQILGDQAHPAQPEDWDTEYNDYIIAIKVVHTLDEAISHINQHNTKHSEAIITTNYEHSQRFTQQIDAACVYVNASTRFTDGFEFGFGAEIGISTQKLHARGPMGLKELTTTKYVILGQGQIRE
ncbi:glutamate-5-semialdehyde dehydrogenase [Weissella paramesenteroides]|uniref:glutamate-5-semialdehyde dehydrogenase n=1 Tax=Weissella paramesenteroides TaxID=1249 RepID=UPI0012388CAD|nr:glutamate-5-semialdehyde dehydrogenase [Weissella paramesenteroides]KAA8458136.1 glutamate-5-semialdehyde dehydrogenase [Weissella paramesenteroides]KAA8458877.1 glutamate-5-semialdehyde dehydrogenase [Weissella paramesenteroides]KAA8459376.1 glutamate-5-semialdehyde dehydrogenase [Weissella paramesenteroides]KAA8463401.1 glutamate-5-semialdehyde dehydrogenase [Weissella paramesenteroides]KAA8464017.1 glutamate-5-semialdehyde dehydrogenase [Weissella paramesenteroides]